MKLIVIFSLLFLFACQHESSGSSAVISNGPMAAKISDSVTFKVKVLAKKEACLGELYKADIIITPAENDYVTPIFLGPVKPFQRNLSDSLFPLVLERDSFPNGYGHIPLLQRHGVGKYSVVATPKGKRYITGAVRTRNPSGLTYTWYPFNWEYECKTK